MSQGKLLRAEEPVHQITSLLTTLHDQKQIFDKMTDDQVDMCIGGTISLCHASMKNFVYNLVCIQLYMLHMVNLGLVCFNNYM